MSQLPLTRRDALQLMTVSTAATLLLKSSGNLQAATPRVFENDQLPDDARLGALKDLNGYFPWEPSASPEAWQERADYVRRQILVACGLWPMPARPTINATVHGKIERDDYTVEKVSFESHAGLYVTGSLYRPLNSTGKHPAVLCPHGHWATGRFYDHGEAKVAQELELGAEKFAVGGRHPIQARCVHLARMGCVVFVIDMLGYADNQVLSYDLIHRFAKQRPEMSSLDGFGLFSAQSELWLLNALGLQTWNAIRALDWLETLPDVDPTRIAVTGASGGGTQTFIVGAVDPRPIALFPAVMVSTAMQGGCTCENASHLRIGTGNIEFAALLAPRTVGMSAANDWTKELETKGLPQLKQHFEMLGVGDKLSGKHYPFEHNYNHVSRAMMYGVFQKALGLNDASTEERDYQPLTVAEASVWDAEHPAPPTGEEAERKVLRGFVSEFRAQLASLTPRDTQSLAEFRTVVGGGWDILIGRSLKTAGTATVEKRRETTRTDHTEYVGVVRNTTYHEELPFVTLIPFGWNQQLVIWLTDEGKSGLYDAQGAPVRQVQKLLNQGVGVVGADLLYQGEFNTGGTELTEARRVNNPREFLGFTAGYNHPLFAQRTHDVLTLIAAAKSHESPPVAIHLAGQGHASLYAAAACAQSGDTISKVSVTTNGYRFGTITDIRDPMLLPGALRYGDVPGLLALCAPHPLQVIGEQANQIATTTAAYRAAGKPDRFTLNGQQDVAEWIIG